MKPSIFLIAVITFFTAISLSACAPRPFGPIRGGHYASSESMGNVLTAADQNAGKDVLKESIYSI